MLTLKRLITWFVLSLTFAVYATPIPAGEFSLQSLREGIQSIGIRAAEVEKDCSRIFAVTLYKRCLGLRP